VPAQRLDDSIVVHRFGNADIEGLRLKDRERTQDSPGISILIGGTAEEAAAAMLEAYPDPRKHSRIHEQVKEVRSTRAGEVRRAGFDVIHAPSAKLPMHGRIIHAQGMSGFSDENLHSLSMAFKGEQG
jgi:hypothetical protein